VRFHVALAMEHVGLWTQALDGYAQAASEAGTTAPDVVREASEHIASLTKIMPTVSLRVAGAAAGDELLLDRRPLPIDDRPFPIRADPGAHTAELRRGGTVLAREYFAVEARSTRRIELRVGSIAVEPDPGKGPEPVPPPGPPPDPAARAGTAGEGPPTVPPVVPPGAGRVPRALGWTAIGMGAGSLAAMGVFIGERASAMASLTSACPSLTHCPTSVASTVSTGKTDAMVVNITAVAGGVLAATGIVLLVVAPSRSAPSVAAPPPAAAWIGIRPAGVTIGGAFR
jgi:hypothetical protein